MADVQAELTTGRNPNGSLPPYGLAHEKKIRADFSREIAGAKWSSWIASAGQKTAAKPADLGCFVGYRLCQSYYRAMADKKQAVHETFSTSAATPPSWPKAATPRS